MPGTVCNSGQNSVAEKLRGIRVEPAIVIVAKWPSKYLHLCTYTWANFSPGLRGYVSGME